MIYPEESVPRRRFLLQAPTRNLGRLVNVFVAQFSVNQSDKASGLLWAFLEMVLCRNVLSIDTICKKLYV